MMQFHSTSDIRIANRVAILSSIARRGSASRLDVAESTGLTTAAISRITRELIDIGVLIEADEPVTMGGRGRRVHELQIAATSLYIIVMVISANRRAVAMVNGRGDMCCSAELDAVDITNATLAIDEFVRAANELVESSGIDRARLLGVSAVIAVNTNPAHKNSISSSILGWTGVDLADQLSNKLSLPVHLEARAAALLQTELWERPAVHDRSIVLINNGWRIGSCVSMHGELLESPTGRIGQVAHLSIVDIDHPCYCGKTGCLDAIASGEAIVKALVQQRALQFGCELSLIQKLNLAIDEAVNNKQVARIFHDAGEKMGGGLNSVVNLFEPERILLAGATGRQVDFVKGVRKVFSGSPLVQCDLEICEADSVQAAIRTGLDAFLFTVNFNMQRWQQDDSCNA